MVIQKIDMRPGEVVLTNRIRMNHPANHRDDCLPSTDLELCDLICKASKVAFLDGDTARAWCRKHIMDELDSWDEFEQKVAIQRLGKLWGDN